MADYTAELKRLLKDAGCRFVRQGKGDHEIWEDAEGRKRFPVDARILSKHTANAVLKQAGLEKAF